MNGLNIAIILPTSVVTLTFDMALAAAPPLPSSFYGTVSLGGQNVPEETVVSAWIEGFQIVETGK